VVVEEVEEVGGANGRIGGIGDGHVLIRIRQLYRSIVILRPTIHLHSHRLRSLYSSAINGSIYPRLHTALPKAQINPIEKVPSIVSHPSIRPSVQSAPVTVNSSDLGKQDQPP
jgi:hypothetical protein